MLSDHYTSWTIEYNYYAYVISQDGGICHLLSYYNH